jgi:hypothetical protein
MNSLDNIAPAFVEMAHRIVWCTASTVTSDARPRSRLLHPLWDWDGASLTGWIATAPTKIKRADLAANPHMTCTYWHPTHDTATAECAVAWCFDIETRAAVWDKLKSAPAPVGYDPAIVPGWTAPTDDRFAVLRLTPQRLRVLPGTAMLGGGSEISRWEVAT